MPSRIKPESEAAVFICPYNNRKKRGVKMAQTVIRTQPINLTGLWRLKVLLPETRELLDIMGELRRTGKVEKDDLH